MTGDMSLSSSGSDRTRRGVIPPVVVSAKTSSAYQTHSYPTKIPPEAITPFIEACTKPGGVVLDPFCGSGMTGVAALSASRSVILSDLSPGAVHLARSHTEHVDPQSLLSALDALDQSWMRRAERRLYATTCPTCRRPSTIRHVIWSDVHRCPTCRAVVRLWDIGRQRQGHIPRTIDCLRCGARIHRSGQVPLRAEPVERVVECGGQCCRLQTGPVGRAEAARLRALEQERVRQWFPVVPIEPKREMYKRSALHLRGVSQLSDFYLPRARLALSELWYEINNGPCPETRQAMQFAFTNTAWHASRMRRYNARGGQRPLTGTLYIPQLVAEANVFEVFRHQLKQVASFYDTMPPGAAGRAMVRQSSASDLSWLADRSVDYVFTDPPFGSNIFYADCNLVWEAWLGAVTDTEAEMVVNRSRTAADGGKSVDDYGQLLEAAFSEIRRVLRRKGSASIVFHNSDDEIWSAMLRAAEKAGLRQVDVSILDKVQRSMKGYRGRAGQELVPFYDLVITFRPGRVRSPQLNGAGELAEEAVEAHLGNLGTLGAVPQRRVDYLYSVAVAHVVSRGAQPEGLSYRAFESLCNHRFERVGHAYYLR